MTRPFLFSSSVFIDTTELAPDPSHHLIAVTWQMSLLGQPNRRH